MEMNAAGLDRLVRIFVGVVLLFLTFTGQIGMWGLVGAVPIITGLSGMCPLYTILGINTCKLEKSEDSH